MAKIYTKGGDKGETSLVGGQRVPKTSTQIESYGTVDELNTALGLAIVVAKMTDNTKELATDLETIQHWLFDLGSLLAATDEDRKAYKLRQLTAEHVTWLEGRIDAATAKLPPLKNFILPGGCELSARLQFCRTVARRAERVTLDSADVAVLPPFAVPFLNRLSDYLFVAARLANQLAGKEDILWREVVP
jgi:cob(I)alamin adenosyltransferase